MKINLDLNQYQIHLKRILHLDIKPENFIEVLEPLLFMGIVLMCMNVDAQIDIQIPDVF